MIDRQKLKPKSLAVSIAITVFATFVGLSASAQRVLLDRVIALVDEGVILQSELDIRINDLQQAAARDGRPLPPESEIRDDVLEALIVENIQLQMAEQVSIRYDDDTINRVLSNMAENSNMSFDEYVTALENGGVYLQTREQVRQQMMIQELQRGMVNRRITITEQEIDNFLNSEMGREVMAPDFFIDHMVVVASGTDSDEEKQQKLRFAADLTAQVEEGSNFLQVRAEASESSNFQIQSTDFGWRKAEQLPILFSSIVVEMKEGEIAGPIEAGNGYHVIFLAGKRGGTEQIVKQTNIRHIMLSPNEIRNEEQTITEIQELRQRILSGEDFAVIARQHSDDATSVVAGGDLDWVNEGGMPPEFEAVIQVLEENTLSEPFESATGWHIAEVLGRRESDLSQQYTRSQAANSLRNRKFDLELQNWMIEIREKAFVEFID
uniref:Parvulin-like peptidyl-prolyl isomerase n=1 Tax=uncultured bacterium HF130_01F24 TaxID=710814 RepID=E0XPJ8_9BACT|nr:parvulin-like peptidyl-prolyl isomerase [uncultured bacterium HF130_01F24]